MTARRSRAALFRELAGIYVELAVVEEADERGVPKGEKRRSSPRLVRITRPTGESDEVSRAQARRILRQLGFVEVSR